MDKLGVGTGFPWRLVSLARRDIWSSAALIVVACAVMVPGATARSEATTVVSFGIAANGVVGSGLLQETGTQSADGYCSLVPAVTVNGTSPTISLTRGPFGTKQLRLKVISGRYLCSQLRPGGVVSHLRLRVTVTESDDTSCSVGAQGTVEVTETTDDSRVDVKLCGQEENLNLPGDARIRATVTELRCPQSAAARRPGCALLAQPKPTEPTTMTLTVNGKSATATTAKPSNDDPNPLVVHYGTSLNIAVTANAPMPKGWSIVVRHNGDVLSSSGNYHGVCEVKTGASSCTVTRPPPTAALTGDVDDVVFAQLLAPDHLVFNVQILVNYRK